jgi:regulation of enolase protein 1 (concanavalin A-like superfamily)
MNIDFSVAKWLNQPKLSEISSQLMRITTDPNTDFWQRSYQERSGLDPEDPWPDR